MYHLNHWTNSLYPFETLAQGEQGTTVSLMSVVWGALVTWGSLNTTEKQWGWAVWVMGVQRGCQVTGSPDHYSLAGGGRGDSRKGIVFGCRASSFLYGANNGYVLLASLRDFGKTYRCSLSPVVRAQPSWWMIHLFLLSPGEQILEGQIYSDPRRRKRGREKGGARGWHIHPKKPSPCAGLIPLHAAYTNHPFFCFLLF